MHQAKATCCLIEICAGIQKLFAVHKRCEGIKLGAFTQTVVVDQRPEKSSPIVLRISFCRTVKFCV